MHSVKTYELPKYEKTLPVHEENCDFVTLPCNLNVKWLNRSVISSLTVKLKSQIDMKFDVSSLRPRD